jgi:hypothetical protein
VRMNIDNFFSGLNTQNTNTIKDNTILLEANDESNKYALTEEKGAGAEEENDVKEVPEETDKYAMSDDELNSEDDQTTNPNGSDDQGEETPIDGNDGLDSTGDSDEQINGDTEEQDNIDGEDIEPKEESSDIKILNLSDKDKQLNNLKLFKRFGELRTNTSSALTMLTDRNGRTPTEQQVIDFVAKNLGEMIDELEMFMTAKFSDVYETNTNVYLTYLHRYKVAMGTIRTAYDKLSETDEK